VTLYSVIDTRVSERAAPHSGQKMKTEVSGHHWLFCNELEVPGWRSKLFYVVK